MAVSEKSYILSPKYIEVGGKGVHYNGDVTFWLRRRLWHVLHWSRHWARVTLFDPFSPMVTNSGQLYRTAFPGYHSLCFVIAGAIFYALQCW